MIAALRDHRGGGATHELPISDGGWSNHDAGAARAADELHDDAKISDATWQTLASALTDQQLLDVIFTIGNYHVVSFASTVVSRIDPWRARRDVAELAPATGWATSPQLVANIHQRSRGLGYNYRVAQFARLPEPTIGVALTDLVPTRARHVDVKGGVRTRMVLDTSVLVADPSCISSFVGADVVIPLTVIEELDG